MDVDDIGDYGLPDDLVDYSDGDEERYEQFEALEEVEEAEETYEEYAEQEIETEEYIDEEVMPEETIQYEEVIPASRPQPQQQRYSYVTSTKQNTAPSQQIVYIQSPGSNRAVQVISQANKQPLPPMQVIKSSSGAYIPLQKQIKVEQTKPSTTYYQTIAAPSMSANKTRYIVQKSGGAGGGNQVLYTSPTEQRTVVRTIVSNQPASRPVTLNRLPNKAAPLSQTIITKTSGQQHQQIRTTPSGLTITKIRAGAPSTPQQTRIVIKQEPPSSPPARKAQGALQAVNIPGKGIQYVRVLNSQAPTITASGARSLNASAPLLKATTPQHYTVQQKTGQTYTLVQSGGQTKVVSKPSPYPVSIQRRSLPSTGGQGAAGRGGPQKIIAVVKKEDGKTVALPTGPGGTAMLTTSQLNKLKGVNIIPGSNNKTKIVMLPSNYLEQLQSMQRDERRETIRKPLITRLIKKENEIPDPRYYRDAQGNLKKRPCNCTKSQCLKLYCDCFAAGEFCADCNCKDCCNNLANEDERQKAIRACLDRNPHAFKPKVTITDEADHSRRHHKGCNCKRSGCLKNYCECYEAKVTCSSNCKCLGCKNFDPDMAEEKEAAEQQLQKDRSTVVKRPASESLRDATAPPPTKQPYNFMTPDVIEATVQCMIAQAEECQKRNLGAKESEKMILEEFGRCLVEIIDFSGKNEG